MLPVLWASASLSQQGTAAGFAFHLEAVGEKVPVLSTVILPGRGGRYFLLY